MTSIPKFTSFKAKPKLATPGAHNDSERNKYPDTSTDQKRSTSGKLEDFNDRRDSDRSTREPVARPRHRSPRAGIKPESREREKHDSAHRQHRSERHHRKSSQDHRDRHHRHDEDYRGRDRHQSSDIPRPFRPEEFEESDLFLIDRRGDAKNVEYGSLHRYSVPQHKRVGFGFLVGLPATKIDREASTEKETVLIDPNRRSARQPRALISNAGKAQNTKLRLVIPASIETDSKNDDLIYLSALRKRKRGEESPEGLRIDTVDYRSIEGKAKTVSSSVNEDMEEGSDSDAAPDEEVNLLVRQQSSVLSKQAKANATDLSAWLALAEHQANLVRTNGSPDVASFSTSERRALSDLCLSILNEASKHIVKSKAGREELLLAIIEEGRHIWDGAKLDAKWHEALKECSASIVLWTKYLDFVQDNSRSFRYEVCKTAYIRCLRLLHDSQAASDSQRREEVGATAVYMFLRYTSFLRDAGFDELAIASWQAMLEYHLFMPAEFVRATSKAKISSFEEYWDSEVPRIGEEHSPTWSRAHEKQPSAARALPTGQKNMVDSATSIRHLADEDVRLLGRLVLPATMDDDSVTDPFRHVMFSDIRESLVDLDVPKASLVNAFLKFMNLPNVPSFGQDLSHSRDPHLASGLAVLFCEPNCADKLRARLETTTSLFQSGFEHFQALVKETHDETLPRFVDRVLEAFAGSVSGELRTDVDHLAEYYIAFKQHLFPEEARKLAKRLLKGKPSSLRLYNAYAMVEASMPSAEKADMVWKTALDMSSSFGLRDDLVLLWHSRLVTNVRRNDVKKALRELLPVSNDVPTSEGKAQRLKMQRELESGFDRAMLSGHSQPAAIYVDLLAWLAYLAENSDITKAIAVYQCYDGIVSKQNATSDTRELIHQYKANLIVYHLDCQKQYRPAVLRQECESSLRFYPSNSILLDVYQRLQTQDRLRTVFEEQKHSTTKPTAIEWSHRLISEIHRNETYGTTVNAVRATFSKALLDMDSGVRHSSALWMLWFKWELRRPKGETKAKQVFLDGLRHLPWCKFWIIIGMKHLRDNCSDREVRQWHEVMIERGLRARVELEA
ncbi:Nuclear exosome regulator NRDE2 [Pseudocercospora fuligena]|uniref:Nuclear exosome regulator NRDE2 n=1 Tax=Pseudocercospora fuligena TaxID=685502 RepID=A0A8H6RKI6_9PEZI|nr:Nuclear exosome regulator NRDE2 [Pseudocercospora fuligena]